MMQLLISFGCGIAFALGAVTGIALSSLASKQVREETAKDMHKIAKDNQLLWRWQVDLVARQVGAIIEIAEAQKRRRRHE